MVVRGVLLQQIVQAIVAIILFTVTGNDEAAQTENSALPVLLRQFFVAIFVLDTWQYFMHRYMHHNKYLYKHIHSQHHRLVVPYAFGALYNHPFVMILGTYMPYSLESRQGGGFEARPVKDRKD